MFRPRIIALIGASMLMAACATTMDTQAPSAVRDPETIFGQEPARTPTPARARSRAPSDWPAERARISALLTGMDDVSISERADGSLQLVLPGADAFARDQSEPRPRLRATLDRIAAALADRPRTDILILGHTDSMGSELHNLALSIRRAEAVAEYLRTRGIALARLTADGRGEAEPIADNGAEAGRATNRRVEIVVRPLE